MDGIHDMGGMHGFGPVPYQPDDPPYHAEWERRVFGMALSARLPDWMNLDYSRHSLERIPPDVYLSSSYFERWLYGQIMRQVEAGQVSMAEFEAGKVLDPLVDAGEPLPPEAVNPYQYAPFRQEVENAPLFSIGQSVLTADPQTTGHTRLPRYARNRRGVVHLHHGAHILPDSHAHGSGDSPTHLYTVKFKATELWGEDANKNDHLFVDVWECHLNAG